MRRTTERCDEIIDLIDRCLAELTPAAPSGARRRDEGRVLASSSTR